MSADGFKVAESHMLFLPFLSFPVSGISNSAIVGITEPILFLVENTVPESAYTSSFSMAAIALASSVPDSL